MANQNFEKRKLSGSTDGKQINITTTATAGTLIHTAITGTTDYDEIYIYANNISTTDQKITIEWGGVTTADQKIVNIPNQSGDVLIVDGLPLQNGQVVRIFSGTTATPGVSAVINVSGFVNRITA